jgi:glycosyltransferase involved in cell wall biosynthesis
VSAPRVSVCVPTYNGSAFLAQTLATIAAQTFEDYEVVVVDDLSTDESFDIARRCAAGDARVRVIRNTTRAGSSARNANQCLRHARGEWIKFLFQDDLMAPACLSRMLDAGRRGPFVIAWHDYLFEPGIDAATRTYYEELPTLAALLPVDYASVDQFCDAVLNHWNVNFIGPTSTSFVRRDCFERHGSFNGDIVGFPDLECWARLGNNEGLSIVREPLVSFRVHATSISARIRNDSGRQYRHSLEAALFLCKLAREPGYQNLRSRALHRDEPIDVPAMTAEAVFDARWTAIEERFRRRDRTQLNAWNAFYRANTAVREIAREADRAYPVWWRFKQYLKAHL